MVERLRRRVLLCILPAAYVHLGIQATRLAALAQAFTAGSVALNLWSDVQRCAELQSALLQFRQPAPGGGMLIYSYRMTDKRREAMAP
ncbi:MAG: hypothetical protein ACI87T_001327 [Planctomycetota bacterium]|jgi:hypothetical protein